MLFALCLLLCACCFVSDFCAMLCGCLFVALICFELVVMLGDFKCSENSPGGSLVDGLPPAVNS